MKVRLTKIRSTHHNLRTDVIVGETEDLPTVGKRFDMTGPPLYPEHGAIRVISTSPVAHVVEDNGYLFTTVNSVYRLEILH